VQYGLFYAPLLLLSNKALRTDNPLRRAAGDQAARFWVSQRCPRPLGPGELEIASVSIALARDLARSTHRAL